MKCKNCGHDIYIEGIEKDQVAMHFNASGGCSTVCIWCGCNKPERRSKPNFCKNCGHEIVKRRGKWLHIHVYTTSAGGIPNRPRQHQRLTVPHCYGIGVDGITTKKCDCEEAVPE